MVTNGAKSLGHEGEVSEERKEEDKTEESNKRNMAEEERETMQEEKRWKRKKLNCPKYFSNRRGHYRM